MAEIIDTTVKAAICTDNFNNVVQEYIKCNVNPDAQGTFSRDYYLGLEKAGVLRVLLVRDGGKCVGFSTIIKYFYAHHGKTYGAVESLFLLPEYRKQGLGKKLLNETFKTAKEFGCEGVYLGAPVGSVLAKVYSRLFTPLNIMFWHKL